MASMSTSPTSVCGVPSDDGEEDDEGEEEAPNMLDRRGASAP
jgi:hypothetical protein